MGGTSQKCEHLIYTTGKPEITHTINPFTYQWGIFCLQIVNASSKHYGLPYQVLLDLFNQERPTASALYQNISIGVLVSLYYITL